MKEKPIIFSESMIQPILEGRKTQTRRLVNPQPIETICCGKKGYQWNKKRTFKNMFKDIPFGFFNLPIDELVKSSNKYCPYGQPGDRLWVREKFWYPLHCYDESRLSEIRYIADGPTPKEICEKMTLRMPLYMWRWASRITLEITDIRVERLQDISEEDAEAEGCTSPIETIDGKPWTARRESDRYGFSLIWDFIHKKDGFDWGANPWVWVIEFKRVK